MEMNDRPVCHRAEDLVTFLYGAANPAEARDFADHTAECDACRAELAMFQGVHDSIVNWRNEALGMTASCAPVFIASENVPAAQPIPERLSAVAALREFFTVSPLWLRGATTFGALLLMALLVFFATRSLRPAPLAAPNAGDKQLYTAEQVREAVNQALQQASPREVRGTKTPAPAVKTSDPNRSNGIRQNGGSAVARDTTIKRERSTRVPALTRAEREQLAADLRLIPGQDDEEFPFILSAAPDQR